MIRFLLAFAVAAVVSVSVAYAQSGMNMLSWIPATTYSDGSPMQLGSQNVYVFRDAAAGPCAAEPPPAQSFTLLTSVSAGVASFVHSLLWNSTYYYVATSVDVFGVEGSPSNVACKQLIDANNWQPPPAGVRPMPPSNLAVQ